MAEKADFNGDKKLSGAEISLFNEIEATLDASGNTFTFGNNIYDKSGKETAPFEKHIIEKPVSTKVYRQPTEEEIKKEIVNNSMIQKAKEFSRESLKFANRNVTVKKTIDGKNIEFTFNRSKIEEHIFYNSVDSHGNKITIFSDIPEIRKKPFAQRTKEECRKLVEFNNMMNSIINSGVEYGVDPKLITAIIQREVGFNGLSKNVLGANGNGYMQLTSAPIKDILGGYTKKRKLYFADYLKTNLYGREVEQLLISRGFKTDCPPEQREELVNNIMNYLINNKDTDFNIRMGTLVLRYYLNKSDGNVQIAAQNYNGHLKHKIAYGKAVNNFYNQMNSLHKKT